MNDEVARELNCVIQKILGASPSRSRIYTLIMFDISNDTKRRIVVKALNTFTNRVQNSVFEGYLKQQQVSKLIKSLRNIFNSERYFNENDKIRIYQISGKSDLFALGPVVNSLPESDVFI